MKPPRARFTIRRLMLMVALVAVPLGLYLAHERSRRATDYRTKAAYFALYERLNMVAAQDLERQRGDALARGDQDEVARLTTYLEESEAYTAWWARKRRLYEFAASHPLTDLPPELRDRPFPHLEPNPRSPSSGVAGGQDGRPMVDD